MSKEEVLSKLNKEEITMVFKQSLVSTALFTAIYILLSFMGFELFSSIWIEILSAIIFFALQFTFLYLTKSLDKKLEELKQLKK